MPADSHTGISLRESSTTVVPERLPECLTICAPDRLSDNPTPSNHRNLCECACPPGRQTFRHRHGAVSYESTRAFSIVRGYGIRFTDFQRKRHKIRDRILCQSEIREQSQTIRYFLGTGMSDDLFADRTGSGLGIDANRRAGRYPKLDVYLSAELGILYSISV